MRFSSNAILSVPSLSFSFTALLPTNPRIVAAVRLDHELASSASGSLRAVNQIQDNEGHLVLESLLSPVEGSSSSSDQGTVRFQGGNECSISSSFEASEKDVDSKDMGVLFITCVDGEECFPDETSSRGGRCGVRFDEEGYLYDDAGVAELHRNLAVVCASENENCIPCTMVDGTAGKKCDGINACLGINDSLVSCGACVGDFSCLNAVGPIAESSCNGFATCAGVRCEFKWYSPIQFKTVANDNRLLFSSDAVGTNSW